MDKEMVDNLNEIKDKLGITAFDMMACEFFRMSEKFDRVYEARAMWRDRAEKAEKELKDIKKS